MTFQRRIRTIALSGLKNIKDRLDKIDLEEETGAEPSYRAESDARRELAESLRSPQVPDRPIRTPEQIIEAASGNRTPAGAPRPVVSEPSASPLDKHYKRLNLESGADFEAVHAAYTQLVLRCAPDRYPEGSDEQRTAEQILARVEESYGALREALDSTAGRFDKLEL